MIKINKFNGKLHKICNFCTFIKIDFSFILLFIVCVFLDSLDTYFLFTIFVILHELIHLMVAKKFGYLTGKLYLTFFGASLDGEDDFSSSDELKVVFAGPFFNLCVIIFCYLCFWFYPESYHYLHQILLVNWSIFLFNMLPIFPLDCGRIILVILNKKYDRQMALKLIKRISFCFVMILFFLFLISFFYDYNFTFGFVCINLASLMFSCCKDTSFKRQLFADRKLKILNKGLIERKIYIDSKTPNFKLYKFIDDYHYTNFVFIDDEFKEIRKISEYELFKVDGFV